MYFIYLYIFIIYILFLFIRIKENLNKKELNDWIITAKWLLYDGYNYLCVLLAHNNVCIYDIFNKCCQNTWCEEKCILYPYICN